MAFSSDWGHLKPFTRELTTAVMPTGSVMGALVSWTLVEMAQPRLVTAYATLAWVLGSLIQLVAPSIEVVRSGRLICGIGAGIVSAVVPPYLAEIAGRSSRGMFARYARTRIDAAVGQLALVAISGGIGSASDSGEDMRADLINLLRCSFAVQLIPGFALMFLCDFLPPSPRRLATEGRWPEVKSLLADLHASGDRENGRVLAHVQELEADVLDQPQVPHPSRELLTWRVRARLVLGILVAAWSQLCGVPLVLNYIMLAMAGSRVGSLDFVVVVQYLVYILSTLPAIFVLDSWGRRLTMKLGCLWMIITLCGTGYFQNKRIDKEAKDGISLDETHVPWALEGYHGTSLGVIIFCYLFIVAYAMFWSPIAWLYPAEIFPGWLRTRGFGICMAAYWISNAGLAWGLPSLGNTTDSSLVNWVAWIFVCCAVHETKGYTLEEMHHVFLSGRRAWQSAWGERIFDLLVARIERQQNLHGTDGAVEEPGEEIELSEWTPPTASVANASPT
ncbi:MFS general substrate transporter [Trichoderma longibrachiatum ATCC 18648]|uniref:MFS general substrate transporter n=1 Tax=Trichoderma longibrachiatum ATCC 18648 TaxID=983965 RepID=A0A2T4C6U2_TRILO|nr:MFS general substrate transporter [Trichoderma longibrachiatum ATCC 18648]